MWEFYHKSHSHSKNLQSGENLYKCKKHRKLIREQVVPPRSPVRAATKSKRGWMLLISKHYIFLPPNSIPLCRHSNTLLQRPSWGWGEKQQPDKAFPRQRNHPSLTVSDTAMSCKSQISHALMGNFLMIQVLIKRKSFRM